MKLVICHGCNELGSFLGIVLRRDTMGIGRDGRSLEKTTMTTDVCKARIRQKLLNQY